MARILCLNSKVDERGTLTVLQDEIPFDIKRVFYIYNSDGSIRGGHRHHRTIQAAVCINGECKIFINNGKESQIYNLNKPDICLILEPEDFHEMIEFNNNAILLVLASENYDPNDYIFNNYG
jgi:dTDP-4-dehydrorhamnose 3,5-epimerase-like enzyme